MYAVGVPCAFVRSAQEFHDFISERRPIDDLDVQDIKK
jgi:hypothetical protein